jgi:hypothetical protein
VTTTSTSVKEFKCVRARGAMLFLLHIPRLARHADRARLGIARRPRDGADGGAIVRAAHDRGYFRTNTDKKIYDTEEFLQAFEQFLTEMRLVLGGSGAR